MPKRSLNRVLGAKSLELKCLLLFGLFLMVVITASFLMYWHVTGKVVKEKNPTTAKLLVDQVLLITHWSETEDKDATQNWRNYLHSLTQDLSDRKFKWRFIGRPDDSENRKYPSRLPYDEFERTLLSDYLHNPPQADEDEERDRLVADGEEYQYYKPVRVKQLCWTCHRTVGAWGGLDPTMATGELGGMPSPPHLEVGDLLAVIQVSIPNGRTQAAVNKYWGLLLAVAIITVFLAMVASYVIVRYVIVKPLRHLRDVSDAISHGNIAQRAEIHTGDEFEELWPWPSTACCATWSPTQDELRQVNANLDGKVDELAQVNMRLYEMNRLKSDFLATMSHELRTPLNSILGFSDVLGSIDSLDDKQKRYVQNIQKSGKMLLDMINDILDLAKIESGKMEIRLTDFRIAQVIGAQCDMARPLTEKKNIDLEIDIEPDLPPMHQDQARVQQILNNLLSNAIKFTPEGGRIKVAAERANHGDLLLRVIDTGVGIAEEDQQTIFEKFRQGQTGHARRRRHDPRVFRHRPGAVDRQGAVQALGGRGHGGERVGQGQHLHRPSALAAGAPAAVGLPAGLQFRGVRQAPSRSSPRAATQRRRLANRREVVGLGTWVLGLGSWVLGLGSWVLGLGTWVLGLGSWVLGLGSWVLGLGSWVLANGQWAMGRKRLPTTVGNALCGVPGLGKRLFRCRERPLWRSGSGKTSLPASGEWRRPCIRRNATEGVPHGAASLRATYSRWLPQVLVWCVFSKTQDPRPISSTFGTPRRPAYRNARSRYGRCGRGCG